MRIAVIGSGAIVKLVLKKITKDGSVKLVYIFSRNKKTSRRLAKKYNARCIDNLEVLISNKDEFDFVYVATPHNSHFEYAKFCLVNRIPVLVEKPIGISKEEIEELLDLQKQNNTYISEAMWTWFSKPMNEVKRIIESKELGRVKKVEFDFSILKIPNRKNRLFDNKRAGGALYDLGIYPLTDCYMLFGKPKKIQADIKMKYGVDIKDKIKFEYDDFSVFIKTGLTSYSDKFKIECENGIIFCKFNGHAPNKIVLKGKSSTRVIKEKTTYLNEFNAVYKDVIDKKTESQISLEDNYHIITMIEDVFRCGK